MLNTASEIRVAFDDDVRRIEMIRGQAMFNVAHDAARPFKVVSGGTVVTAVGTAFDVRRDDDMVTVTLVEGVVNVDAAADADRRRPVRATLHAGERLRLARGDDVAQTGPVDVEAAIGWTEGELIFRGVALEDAVAEINRYLDRKIRLGDPALTDLEVSGVFHVGDRQAFLRSLEGVFPVRVVEGAGGTVVFPRKRPAS